jgi:hypothetical protein
MTAHIALLLIGSGSIFGQIAALAPSPGLDEATRVQMALNKGSESETLAEACVGDERGDVVRLTTCKLLGIPLVLPNNTIVTWSVATDGEKQVASATFSNDNGPTWSVPKDLFNFPTAMLSGMGNPAWSITRATCICSAWSITALIARTGSIPNRTCDSGLGMPPTVPEVWLWIR